MKRVLLTVHKFFPDHRAGTEVLTLQVAQELQLRNYDVLVVTANPPDRDARWKDGPESSRYTYEGVPVHVVHESVRLKENNFRSEFYNPHVRDHFRKVIAEFAPDLVHAFHLQNLSSSIVDEALEQKIPVMVSATDFWFICPIVQLRRPDGALCRGPSTGAINCLTCYTPELFPPLAEFSEALGRKYPALKQSQKRLPHLVNSIGESALFAAYVAKKMPAAVAATVERPKILRDAANRLAAITVPTKLMSDLFIENGLSADLIHHVPFGIDTTNLTNFQQKTPSDKLRIGYIGALNEHKGVDLLITAFQNLPAHAPATLSIYGDLSQFPEYGEQLKALAARSSEGERPVSFCGTFPNTEFGRVISEIDVLVVPSRWYENTPLVIQSALACKTPLIVTNLGGMSELVKHESNGLVFDLNSVESLQKQLLKLLQDPALLARLRSNIKPERTIAQMVDQLESIYALAQAKGKKPVPR